MTTTVLGLTVLGLTVLWLLIGTLSGLSFVRLTNMLTPGRLFPFTFGLIVAACLYIVFSLINGTGIFVECCGGLIYGAIAAFGQYKMSPRWLALGWAAHTIWDTAVHLVVPQATTAPDGYAAFCISFDLIVAAHLVLSAYSFRRVA
ncbi:MAG: DUF6010 family protein [Cyanobacteria bacterium J06631_9]